MAKLNKKTIAWLNTLDYHYKWLGVNKDNTISLCITKPIKIEDGQPYQQPYWEDQNYETQFVDIGCFKINLSKLNEDKIYRIKDLKQNIVIGVEEDY